MRSSGSDRRVTLGNVANVWYGFAMSRTLRSGGFVRRLLIFMLLGAASGAVLIAAAVVPDQTWLGGIYDAADEDAILLLVWDQASPVVSSVAIEHRLTWAGLSCLPSVPLAPVHVRATSDSRAPPLPA